LVDEAGRAKYKDYADYIVNHERRPGVGPLSGWRGNGEAHGRGAPNPAQLDRYIENGGFCVSHIPESARFFKAFNADYQDWAVSMGFFDKPQPYVYQLYLEPLAKFRLAAKGFGDRQPPEHFRARIAATFDPLPIWYPPFEGEMVDGFPLHAITQRPAAMYHAWGSQNAWLRQIHGRNPLYVPGPVCDEHGLEDGDWVWLTSHHGRIKVPVARMDAVNSRTVWTWNAIGKRKGAWALSPDAPETKKGFLLNHLISELLPERRDGMRWSNSDPITGQAAWYDLRVRIEKAEPGEETVPTFPPQASPVGQGPDTVRYGEEWT
jgi:anaerobic selenocysteine-containing dehydrogenase